jgi:hypothetical protein
MAHVEERRKSYKMLIGLPQHNKPSGVVEDGRIILK